MIDTSTKEGRAQRIEQLVKEALERKNWPVVTRLVGGSPRYDFQDYLDADNGEAPKYAQ